MQELAEITSDPDAFERFYREHVGAVQRFVARRVGDPSLAADLTADVFVAVIESAGSYRRSRGEPIAWLFGIAHKVVAGEHRRKARELRATSRAPSSSRFERSAPRSRQSRVITASVSHSGPVTVFLDCSKA